MSGQYLGERVDTPENVDRTDQSIDDSAVITARGADYAGQDVVLNPDAPVTENFPTDAPADDMTVQMAPQVEKITPADPVSANAGSRVALLDREVTENFRTRWNEIQGQFVDEPRSAVQQADALVSGVMDQITQMFAKEHSSLESQWNQGNDVSTEDLRKALQRYRSFFNRLVV